MKHQYGVKASEISVCDENAVAANSNHTKLDHGLHVKRQKNQRGRKISSHLREMHEIFLFRTSIASSRSFLSYFSSLVAHSKNLFLTGSVS
jgi:hypothetical protein